MQLPPELRASIGARLDSVSLNDIAAAAKSVSAGYRREDGRDLQIRSALEAKAYLAYRFPATWCAAAEAFSRLPGIAPQSILDIGAGPGTASLAARARWDGLSASLVEKNGFLKAEGEALLKQDYRYIDGDFTACDFPAADLVCAAYALNESGQVAQVVRKMWQAAGQALVLIEPGTPQGYSIIREARDILIAQGAFIAAPCPHHETCPLAGNKDRWCHFSVRVERSRLHRQAKDGADLPYEDEKFCYLAATRTPAARPPLRAIGHPHGNKVIDIETCGADGQYKTIRVSKRDPLYKTVKKARWGDELG